MSEPASTFAGHDVPRDLHAPHVEQYFGPWAMKEDVFRAAFDRVARMDLRAHVVVQRGRADEREVRREGLATASPRADGEGPDPVPPPRQGDYPVTESGVAVLALTGPLMKTVGSLEEGTSTMLFRRKLRSAANNPAIAGIMIVIDSPGGTVAGTFELAEDIAAAAAKKPTHAYIQDLGCSAAYWAASQAAVISTNVMGIVGSIGTFMPVYDFSGWAQKEGIRVEIVKEGEFKGAGTPGTPVTEEQLAEWQRTINALNEQFVAGVARGRQISGEKAKKLNDGRVHVGAAAKSIGLVDHVETFEQSMKRLEKATAGRKGGAKAEDGAAQPQAKDEPNNNAAGRSDGVDPSAQAPVAGAESETVSMSNPTQTQAPAGTNAVAEPPKAATMAELKAGCPGAPSDFLVEQAEKGATLQQAKDAYLAFQNAQIRARDEEIGKLKASAAQKPAEQAKGDEPEPKKPGVKAVESKAAEAKSGGGAGLDADAVAEYERRVKALTDGGMSRTKASQKVFSDDEQLRQEYLAARKTR